MHFASLLSGGFTTMVVINPPEKKLANHTSVQWGAGNVYLLVLSSLKSKQCRKPHCCNGVVDMFGHCISLRNSHFFAVFLEQLTFFKVDQENPHENVQSPQSPLVEGGYPPLKTPS
jgi:hypothetical protein